MSRITPSKSNITVSIMLVRACIQVAKVRPLYLGVQDPARDYPDHLTGAAKYLRVFVEVEIRDDFEGRKSHIR